jgi:NUDIX domain
MVERPEFLDELVDVVDDQDRVIGPSDSRGHPTARCASSGCVCHLSKLCRTDLRASPEFDAGRLSRLLDMMVAGHVKAGETYEQAALRELAEELGISGAQPRALFKNGYDDQT